MKVKSESEVAQSCPTVSNPMDCSPPGSSITTKSTWIKYNNICTITLYVYAYVYIVCLYICINICIFTMKWKGKLWVSQSCPTPCDPMDCSPPGSSVHGILQARILKWVAIPFSRGSFQPGIEPRSPTLQADSLPSELYIYIYIYLYNSFWDYSCQTDFKKSLFPNIPLKSWLKKMTLSRYKIMFTV